MVNKFWNLDSYSWDTQVCAYECYGSIEDPEPQPWEDFKVK